jgi:hypothetical protein
VKIAGRVLGSRSLLDSLALMERAIQQNLYHEALRRYRAPAGADDVERLLYAGATGGHSGAAAMMTHLAGGTGINHASSTAGPGGSPMAAGRSGSPMRRGRLGAGAGGGMGEAEEDGDGDGAGGRGRAASDFGVGIAGGGSVDGGGAVGSGLAPPASAQVVGAPSGSAGGAGAFSADLGDVQVRSPRRREGGGGLEERVLMCVHPCHARNAGGPVQAVELLVPAGGG